MILVMTFVRSLWQMPDITGRLKSRNYYNSKLYTHKLYGVLREVSYYLWNMFRIFVNFNKVSETSFIKHWNVNKRKIPFTMWSYGAHRGRAVHSSTSFLHVASWVLSNICNKQIFLIYYTNNKVSKNSLPTISSACSKSTYQYLFSYTLQSNLRQSSLFYLNTFLSKIRFSSTGPLTHLHMLCKLTGIFKMQHCDRIVH